MNWFRRMCGLGALLAWVPVSYAGFWQSAWKTQDQQGQMWMNAGRYTEAAKTFQRLDWRAAAEFRAGDYQRAAQDFMAQSTADGYYNAGNALARLGRYQQAIAQYDRALAMNPHHHDAAYNRSLLKKWLQQQPPSNQDKKQDPQKSQSNAQQSSQNQSSEQQKSQQSDAPQSDSSSQSKPKAQKKPTAPSQKTQKTDAPSTPKMPESQTPPQTMTRAEREQKQANEQWLQLIPDDPGGLLREKFMRDHLRRKTGLSS